MGTRDVVLAVLVLAFGAGRPACAGEFVVQGFGWARGIETRGQPSWLEGGFGRLTEGASAPDAATERARGQIQVGFDWRPSEIVVVHVHGLARAEGARDRGARLGISEAFAQFRPEIFPTLALRFRGGTFFPPTSRENVEPLWSSPYTLTLSALNTWIGEEMRLTGLESALVLRSRAGSEVQLAGTVFAAADTLGTLVAWRGWSLGDRLTSIAETLPLPPLPTLRPGGAFGGQQAAGTRPVDELDHRLGWQARARWSRPESAVLQAAYADNRGDRELHRGQYSWRTRFAQVGGELRLGRSLILVGEAALGDAGMGPRDAAHVDVRFQVGYLMLSWGGEKARVSARYDRFENEDRDGTAEPGDETGSAWTVAALWRPQRHLRLGVEFLSLRSQRPAARFSGADPATDARRITAELRLVL